MIGRMNHLSCFEGTIWGVVKCKSTHMMRKTAEGLQMKPGVCMSFSAFALRDKGSGR